MIDCETNCEYKNEKDVHSFLGVTGFVQEKICEYCLKEQLQKAEAENERINKRVASAHEATDEAIDEIATLRAKVEIRNSQLEVSEKANREWEKRYRAMCEEYRAAYREATQGNHDMFTAKQDAEISRLQLIIVGLKAKAEAPDKSLIVCDVRRCDGCSKPFDVCDLNDLADGRMLCDYCELLERMNND